MQYLPREIIDKTLSNFVETVFQPYFPYSNAWGGDDFCWDVLIRGGKLRLAKGQPVPYELRLDRKSLLSLRLVSRTWHASATSLLEKHHWWIVNFDSDASLQKAVTCCPASHPTSRLPARRLKIPPIWGTTLSEKRFQHGAAREFNGWEQRDCMLRKFFDNIGAVDAFSLSLPAASSCHNAAVNINECYDIKALTETAATMQYCLQTSAFANLTDLRLEVPSTYDVGQMTDGLSREARSHLKHLYIRIMDATGCSGNHQFLQWSDLGDRDYDGTTDYYPSRGVYGNPVSNRQWEYPNRKHQHTIWDLVSSCPNLESLGIDGTHFLDLDQLQWQKSQTSAGLRVLHLSRVYIRASTFIALCRPMSDSEPCRLQRLNLKDVKIYGHGGNWGEIFSFLLHECQDLEFAKLWLLTYFTDHVHNVYPDSSEDGALLRSYAEDDRVPLRKLVQRLVHKAGGLRHCTEPMREMAEEMEVGDDDSDIFFRAY